jgi:hypothetical protein
VGDPTAPTLRLREGLVGRFPELENAHLSHNWLPSCYPTPAQKSFPRPTVGVQARKST